MTLFYISSFLMILLLHGYHAANWTSGPQNGDTLYACVGYDVSFPWTYALGTGDVLHDIQWLYQGTSQEIIAIFSHGAFAPLPAFANRVQRLANGGLQISHVTQADRGNYSVEITGVDKSNNQFILKKHLVLEIADDIMTSDHQLHLTMNPIPVLDNTTNTYSIQLQCGNFLFQNQLPFDVQWQTPSGSLHGSSQYKDGQFSLLLPLQAKGGNYTCRVSAHTAGTCVARDMEASVAVDAMDIRLALMEARLTAADIERKQLMSDQKELQDQLNATTMELAATNQRNRLVVSFHARGLTKERYSAGDHLILPTVYTNQGNGYNKTTGVFTSPVSGTYCFIASTGSSFPDHWAGLYIVQGGSNVGYARAYDHYAAEMATGHAVLHLVAGETVWLNAMHAGEYFWSDATWFSGVLISPDT